MSQLLLAVLTLSGLLPTAEVLTVGADQGKGHDPPLSQFPPLAFLLGDAGKQLSVKLKSLAAPLPGPTGQCALTPLGERVIGGFLN